jgi:hypothetical protein
MLPCTAAARCRSLLVTCTGRHGNSKADTHQPRVFSNSGYILATQQQ